MEASADPGLKGKAQLSQKQIWFKEEGMWEPYPTTLTYCQTLIIPYVCLYVVCVVSAVVVVAEFCVTFLCCQGYYLVLSMFVLHFDW